MNTFEGKSVIVTGVASGLGHALAIEFRKAGALVTGCDVKDEPGLAAMTAIGATYVHADVSREQQVQDLIGGVVARHGRLDVMVNNAAISVSKDLANTSEEELDRILAVNLKGPFFGTKHAVRAMLESGGGNIVNVASILGLVADGMLAAYCAAKGGVLGLTRAAAVQYGDRGIRVNAICPGDIDTPLVAEYFEMFADPKAARESIEKEYPMKRMAAPGEIAQAVLFLASPQSSFMTGQSMVVDGGLTVSCY
jgi:NAD(P)-dependent dehydrogenase (short-subunit alcohol dehydrogenase family)